MTDTRSQRERVIALLEEIPFQGRTRTFWAQQQGAFWSWDTATALSLMVDPDLSEIRGMAVSDVEPDRPAHTRTSLDARLLTSRTVWLLPHNPDRRPLGRATLIERCTALLLELDARVPQLRDRNPGESIEGWVDALASDLVYAAAAVLTEGDTAAAGLAWAVVWAGLGSPIDASPIQLPAGPAHPWQDTLATLTVAQGGAATILEVIGAPGGGRAPAFATASG